MKEVFSLSNSAEGGRLITKAQRESIDHFDLKKYRNVDAFLSNIPSKLSNRHQLGHNCNELVFHSIDREKVLMEPNPSSSISYGLFVARGKELGLTLGDMFETRVGHAEHSTAAQDRAHGFFDGSRVELPKNRLIPTGSSHEYRSFEEYSKVNETTQLSPWVYGLTRYVLGEGRASAMELHILIDNPTVPKDRDARMDVVHLSDSNLLCFEVKVSVDKAVQEGRFPQQVPDYRNSLLRRVRDAELPVQTEVIVVPGGGERGLFRETESMEGREFRRLCSTISAPFLTANSLWCLLMQELLDVRGRLTLTQAIAVLREESFVGLTSAGFLTDSGDVVAP